MRLKPRASKYPGKMSENIVYGDISKHVLHNRDISTPAFILDLNCVWGTLQRLCMFREKFGFQILFAMKALGLIEAIRAMKPLINGIAVSSPFEAMLARSILDRHGSIHLTTPGLRMEDIKDIANMCDYIAFNSLTQMERFQSLLNDRTSCGIRVNPQRSFASDTRYDPCRPHSKLGIPLDSLVLLLQSNQHRLQGIHGMHIHSNCDSGNLSELLSTVRSIDKHLPGLLERIDWINLGGGYSFDEGVDNEKALAETIAFLKSKSSFNIFLEPGAYLVQKAGVIVASVLDVYGSEGKIIAILDTTVNHMPEVFEYQFEPDVMGHIDGEQYEYILAGCTCLAGDVFGEYAFNEPLKIGSRVIFPNAGAYTLVKAHMFNGVNLPSIYAYTLEGKLELKKQFGYEDFLSRCGGNNYVPI